MVRQLLEFPAFRSKFPFLSVLVSKITGVIPTDARFRYPNRSQLSDRFPAPNEFLLGTRDLFGYPFDCLLNLFVSENTGLYQRNNRSGPVTRPGLFPTPGLRMGFSVRDLASVWIPAFSCPDSLLVSKITGVIQPEFLFWIYFRAGICFPPGLSTGSGDTTGGLLLNEFL